MPRKILHLDLDAFFCAVEELRRPELAGIPFAVGGKSNERGVISSCSYAARACGVRSAMPTGRALRLCPELVLVSPDHHRYSEASRQVMERLHNRTALVEQISIDEAFLDLTDLPEPGEILARKLQAEVRQHLRLPCSLGVASNKLVAKIATDAGKAAHRGVTPPCAITVVEPGKEADFLAPLPVTALWGVGPKTAAHFAGLGILTIGDLAARSQAELVSLLGKNGNELYARARGIDDRPVVTEYAEKSISHEITFAQDVSDPEQLAKTLCWQADSVAKRLRQGGLTGRVVRLKLRWPDFTTLTRQVSLVQPTDLGSEIYTAARRLFDQVWQPGRAVRLLGVGVSKLDRPPTQLALWDTTSEKDRRLQQTLDSLQERFGKEAIGRGDKILKEK